MANPEENKQPIIIIPDKLKGHLDFILTADVLEKEDEQALLEETEGHNHIIAAAAFFHDVIEPLNKEYQELDDKNKGKLLNLNHNNDAALAAAFAKYKGAISDSQKDGDNIHSSPEELKKFDELRSKLKDGIKDELRLKLEGLKEAAASKPSADAIPNFNSGTEGRMV